MLKYTHSKVERAKEMKNDKLKEVIQMIKNLHENEKLKLLKILDKQIKERK